MIGEIFLNKDINYFITLWVVHEVETEQGGDVVIEHEVHDLEWDWKITIFRWFDVIVSPIDSSDPSLKPIPLLTLG